MSNGPTAGEAGVQMSDVALRYVEKAFAAFLTQLPESARKDAELALASAALAVALETIGAYGVSDEEIVELVRSYLAETREARAAVGGGRA